MKTRHHDATAGSDGVAGKLPKFIRCHPHLQRGGEGLHSWLFRTARAHLPASLAYPPRCWLRLTFDIAFVLGGAACGSNPFACSDSAFATPYSVPLHRNGTVTLHST